MGAVGVRAVFPLLGPSAVEISRCYPYFEGLERSIEVKPNPNLVT